MARIPFLEQNVTGTGVPDLAQQRPSQALSQFGQQAAQAESLLTQLADRDAAIDGASALADFRANRSKRHNELRTQTKTPETYTETALSDFDDAAGALVSAHESPRVQAYLTERLGPLRAAEEADSDAWAAGAIVQRSELKAVETVNKYANFVQSNPGKFRDALDDVGAMVDAAGLPVGNADKIRATARQALSRSAVYGQIETDPAGVLKQLNGGTWDEYLDSNTKISAVNAAQSEINRRESEVRANAAMARAELSQDARDLAQSDIMSRHMTGQGVPPEALATIKAGMTDKEFERYQSAASKADAVYKLTGDLRTKPLVEIERTIQAAAPKAGATDFATQQSAYEAAQAIAKAEMARRKTDPASAVRDAFPRVAEAWGQVAQNPEDPGHLRVAIKRTMAAQESLGIPADQRKPLPQQVATAVAGDIRGAPADKAAQKLKEYAAQYGENWPTVFRQISRNLDANTMWAVTLDDHNKAAILLETSRIAGSDGKAGSGIPALRKALGVTASGDKSIAAIVAADSDVRDLSAAMARRGGGGSTSVTIGDAIETLALGIMQRNGASMTDATEQAKKALVNDKYNFARVNGVPFVTPKAVDADTAERGARKLQAELRADGIDLPAADPGAITDDTRAQYLSAVKRNGYWVTTPGNKGLELWANDAPVTRYGRPIRATWEVLTGVAPGISAQDRIKSNQDRYKKIFGKVGE